MKDRSDNPSHHERTLLRRSYISLPCSTVSTTICLGVDVAGGVNDYLYSLSSIPITGFFFFFLGFRFINCFVFVVVCLSFMFVYIF